jgi:3-dehydroquinate synthase class II
MVGDFKAPVPIHIKAGIKHTFLSLEPNTIVYCIHATGGDEVEVLDEHTHVRPSIIGGV